MVNDILDNGSEEDVEQGKLAGAAAMLPYANFYADLYEPPLVGRARQLWVTLQDDPQLRAQHDFVDLDRIFSERTGASLREFVTTIMAIMANCLQFDPAMSDCMAKLRISKSTFLSNSVMERGLFDRVIGSISTTPEALRRKVQQSPSESDHWDFRLFQQYPLIEYEPGLFVCHDVGMLVKVLTEGIYWQIHDSLGTAVRNDFRSYFGKVFGAYVAAILRRVFPDRPQTSLWLPQFVVEPIFDSKKDGEVCDGLLDLGTELLLMEFKGSLLTLRTKYSGSSDLLKDELDTKFNKEGAGKKGIQQLGRAISKLAEGSRTKIQGFDFRQYETLTPVLVVYDIALTSPGIAEYLNASLRESLRGLPQPHPKIRHLIVLSARDVECLEAVSRKHDLRQVFRRYEEEAIFTHPGGEHGALPFYDFLYNNYREDMQNPDTLLWKTVVDQFNETGERFFGRTLTG